MEDQINRFLKDCKLEIGNIEKEIYWKDDQCTKFEVELFSLGINVEEIKAAAQSFEGITDKEHILCGANEVEISYYALIGEILDDHKVFFNMCLSL